MPHFSIEYSPNVEGDLDMGTLCSLIAQTALDTGVFPASGIRVRAFRADHHVTADAHSENAFVHITCSMGHGRDQATRSKAGEKIYAAVADMCQALLVKPHFLLSMEIREIDPVTTWKRNSIRPRMEEG